MTLLQVHGVSKTFPRGRGTVAALSDVSVTVGPGETVGVIGESGSGKSTLGRVAVGLARPDSGQVVFAGTDLGTLRHGALQRLRSQLQVVFQEPYESLNPRMRVGTIVAEAVRTHNPDLSGAALRRRTIETFELVGLSEAFLGRFPRELSGGQQQRVGIARAIAPSPKLVVLDEPTSSLDVSVRALILQLLADLRRRLNLAYLFISHDLSTVRYFCTTTVVMYQGRVVEVGPTDEVLTRPAHPYTTALLSASLSPDPRVRTPHAPLGDRPLEPPDPTRTCVLVGRCPLEIDACHERPVDLLPVNGAHEVACLRAT